MAQSPTRGLDDGVDLGERRLLEVLGVRDRHLDGADALKLITKRAITTHNSWTHNIEPFTQSGTNHLYLHPDDAEARGIGDGDMVRRCNLHYCSRDKCYLRPQDY